MPPLAESPLAPETATDIIEKAEALRDNKLFSLEELAELLSIDLEQAAALLAPFLALLGIDLDLDTTKTSFNPSEHQEVRITFKRSDDGTCAAAPAGEVKDTGDMAMALGDDEGAIIPENADEDALLEWYIYHVSCDDLVSDIMALDGELAQLDPDLDPEVLEQFKATKRARRIAMAALKYKEENDLCNPQ